MPKSKPKPEDISEEMLDYLINEQTPDDLLELSKQTIVEDVVDIEIESEKTPNGFHVTGSASVDVELNYGSGEDETSSSSSFPMTFVLELDEEYKIESAKFDVDVSGFYGADDVEDDI